MNKGASAGGVAQGLAAPWAGLRYMTRHPSLWRYGIVPMLLNILITAVALGLLLGAAVWFVSYLHPWFAGGWWWRAVEVMTAVVVLVVTMGLVFGFWVLMQAVLCGYFYNRLARRVELQLGIDRSLLREVPLRYEVVDGLRSLGWVLATHAGLLLLNVVPLGGSALAMAGSLYVTTSTLGRDFLDHPLALRGMRRDEKRRFFRAHRATAVGLGGAVLLLSLIPVLGAVLLTTAVVGAVMLHRRLAEAGDSPSVAPDV